MAKDTENDGWFGIIPLLSNDFWGIFWCPAVRFPGAYLKQKKWEAFVENQPRQNGSSTSPSMYAFVCHVSFFGKNMSKAYLCDGGTNSSC